MRSRCSAAVGALLLAGLAFGAATIVASPAPSRSTGTRLPALAAGAATDILEIARAQATSDTSGLAPRFVVGAEAIQRARLVHNRNADPLLEAPAIENAALLLRLRTREALAAACGRTLVGVHAAADAESLEAALRQQIEVQPDVPSLLALAAGLQPSWREADEALPGLLALVRAGTEVAGPLSFLALHALAPFDPAALAIPRDAEPRDAWELAAQDASLAHAAGSRRLFAADDPGRRLTLAVRALVSGGVLAADLVPVAARASNPLLVTPADFTAARAELDRLETALGPDRPRATPILGSRHNYYRKTGDAAPDLAPQDETLARAVAREALGTLRVQMGSQLLRLAGIEAQPAIEPEEGAPGQTVAATWRLRATREIRVRATSGAIGRVPSAITPPIVVVRPNESVVLRSRYASVPTAVAGALLALDLDLALDVDGWGPVALRDRVLLRIVAPVQASITPVGDPLLDTATKKIEVVVTSRAPRPLAGTIRVLATSDWKVKPATRFDFTLRRPGQSARAQIDLQLPPLASPGPYELAVRLDVEGEMAGTLRTKLVKPVEWVVVGPFAPLGRGQALPPEKGASLAARYTGAGGRQIAWRIAPRDAYDPDGSVDFEALFPEPSPGAGACALTVFDSPEPSIGILGTEGVARGLWNGAPLPSDGRVQVLSGRNTLLVRTVAGPGGWRLQVDLRGTDGEPLRVLANNLSQLLDGYADLERAPVRGDGQPPDRLVVLRFDATAPAQEVAVLGTFNAWVPLELQRQPDGTWTRTLRLRPGRYAYKLLVDGHLRSDPASRTSEPDGFGGRNSLLLVR